VLSIVQKTFEVRRR